MATQTEHRESAGPGVTPVGAVLTISFLASLGTGVFWNAISFIAKHAYDFSQVRNLVLYAAMGLIYTVGAFQAGRVTRRVERWISPRGLLAVTIVGQAVACLAPVTFEGEWALWCAAAGVMATSSLLWPLVESYLTAGRHGASMRSAIGWFNLTWMSAVAVPLLAMAPILERHAEWAIGGLAAVYAVALVPLAWFARRPGHHDPSMARAHVAPEYPMLLRSARVLLPLSYVITSAMTPILPYKYEALGVEIATETPFTATWTIVRVLALIVMMRLGFWHGRWGALLLGGLTMTAGFALIVVAPDVPLMLLGLAALGAGTGIIYYTALYYAMAVGRADVDAGSTHEGLIGAGYTLGPLTGLAGTVLGGGAFVVGAVWSVLALGTVPALQPYLAARRRRGNVETSKRRNVEAGGEDQGEAPR